MSIIFPLTTDSISFIKVCQAIQPSTRLTQELTAVAATRESAAVLIVQVTGALTSRRHSRLKETLLRGELAVTSLGVSASVTCCHVFNVGKSAGRTGWCFA